MVILRCPYQICRSIDSQICIIISSFSIIDNCLKVLQAVVAETVPTLMPLHSAHRNEASLEKKTIQTVFSIEQLKDKRASDNDDPPISQFNSLRYFLYPYDCIIFSGRLLQQTGC